jgi:hypothetical protein
MKLRGKCKELARVGEVLKGILKGIEELDGSQDSNCNRSSVCGE